MEVLTELQLEQFRTRGFLHLARFISPAEVTALQRETEDLHEQMASLAVAEGQTGHHARLENGAHVSWEERDDVRRIRQLMHSELVCSTIDRILHSKKMLAVVRQLIGSPDIIKYHSKLLMKTAHDGSLTPWHQDWGYWRSQSKEPTQLNCMLSIDTADLDNGCIRFVEGSHLQGAVDHARLDSVSFSIGLEGDIDRFPATPVETAAGDAVFFGSLVIHGSAPNASGRNRRANTFAFDRAGNRIAGDAHREALLLAKS